MRRAPKTLHYAALRVKWLADNTSASEVHMADTKTDSFRCACGRVWFFPEYAQENWHILFTLICGCARVYTVSVGCVRLQNKPMWPWKRPRRWPAKERTLFELVVPLRGQQGS